MELYTLDPLLRRENVIDRFESLIWTERFQEFGDFQLDIASTQATRSLLKADTWLAMNESHRVMRVESIEDADDSENRRMLTIKGRSIESILLDRAVSALLSTWATTQKWNHTAPPAAVMRKIFHDICVLGVLDPNDIIPFIVEGSFLSPSTIPEPVDPITVDLDPTAVYDAIKSIGDVWNLGFRMLRNYDASELYFDVYSGTDRTTAQNVVPPVIFTPELDNLQNTKELTSIDKAKNVAYVFSPAGFQMVYGLDVDPEVEGFERRILVVNANDITEDNPDVASALLQRGNEELSKYRTYQAFDGEISQFSQFKYGTHYNLGDVVEMRNKSGVANNMRVTEQIFVSDREGERAYPTLSLNTFINTGSWLSWLNNKTWSELTTEEWATQP
ncbi:minor tail protein [Streptomyces phage Kardashian]|nr:minor tail protein [Streptomyces phage Kardashian]